MEGEAIVLEVVRVTGGRRIVHVGKFALVFMYAEVKQLCWDCGVEHKVAMEELYALQGLVPARDALRDAAIADVVACIFIQLGVVLTGHVH